MHPFQSSPNPALHGTFRLAEYLGDLPVAVPAEVGQLDGASLGFGDVAEGLSYVLGHDDVPYLVLHVVTRLRSGAGFAFLAAAAGGFGAEEVDGPAVRLSEQERPQRAP